MKKEVVIVGVSNYWRSLLVDVLESKGYKVGFYVDSYVQHPRVKTLKPDEVGEYIKDPEGYLFLFTFPLVGGREVVLQKLKAQLGEGFEWWDYKRVYKEFREVFSLCENHWWLGPYDVQKARNAIELFEEEKSKSILESWLKFRETFDVDFLIECEGNHYLPDDLPALMDFLPHRYNFMDVGAYTGGTLKYFIKRTGRFGKEMNTYVGLEPEGNNFSELLKNVEALQKEYPNTSFITLKVACGEEIEMAEIYMLDEEMGKCSSIFYKHGQGEKVLVMPPDMLFHNLRFHAIKMDTEGYEMNCLRGLKRTIKEHKPVLMISLYHKPEDIYEIPNFIKEIEPAYSLYARVHGSFFIETVLYAIPC